jgi:L-serine deaminase
MRRNPAASLLFAAKPIAIVSTDNLIKMAREELELKLREIDETTARLRQQLEALQNVVQSAPGSHRPGPVSLEARRAELDVRDLVLALVEMDRRRQEVTVQLTQRR